MSARRVVLALYLLIAAADAIGKWAAATPAFNRAIAEYARGEAAASLQSAARPSGNFEIFRGASRHLVAGKDLYIAYPDEHVDYYKYSPTFALLFSPFSWLPWPLALFLWNTLGAMVVFFGIERVLSGRTAVFAQACMLLELLRGMQNAQSNALVAGLILLAFVAMERGMIWRSALAVVVGASVKIFPLAALTFALARRRVLRTGVAAAALAVVALSLPLLVTSPSRLIEQYQSWQNVRASDTGERWFSSMALLYRMTGIDLPNAALQMVGVALLLAPLLLRRDRWDEDRFRFHSLCSVLMFVVLFNHQAERAAYLIAFLGATLWYFGAPRSRPRDAWYAVLFVALPVLSTLVPGKIWRDPVMMTYRLALPILITWIVVQRELWRRPSGRALDTAG